jgi:hypothetical protein
MASWLVCFRASVPVAERAAIVRGAGARLAQTASGTPLGDEVAVEVEADAPAVARLRARPEVTAVYPNSEMTLY